MSFRQDEDLFEDSRMSFGQHLEELRWVLVKSLIALGVGCCFGFYFAEEVVEQLNVPLKKALNNYDLIDAKNEMLEDKGYIPPDLVPWMEGSRYVPEERMVDIGELIRDLRAYDPNFAKNLDLRPYRFNSPDFDASKIGQLAKRLSQQKSDANSSAEQLKAVWNRLSPDRQLELQNVAQKSKTGDADLLLTINVFNEVAGSDFYTDDSFAEQLKEPERGLLSFLNEPEVNSLSKMKTWLSENGESAESDAVRRQLNRALLHTVFANELPPLRRQLVKRTVWRKLDFKPQSLGTTDGFLIWLKAGLVTGLLISLPAIIWFLWTFVAAGLYPHEQKYVYIFLPISLLLFFAGISLAYFFVFAPVLDFLFSFNRSMGIAPEMRINEWLSFVMFLPLGFGVAFQLPLVMLFVNRIGFVSVGAFVEQWRVAVMIICVLSMFLTPADPISMVLMAGPLTFLYFLGILMCKWMPAGSENPFEGEST